MDAPTRNGIDVPEWKCHQPLTERGVRMETTTVGLRRDRMVAFFANLPPCVIGMEACGSAHHWAHTLKNLGTTLG